MVEETKAENLIPCDGSTLKKRKEKKRQQSRKDQFQWLSVWESFNWIAFNLINALIPLNVSRLLGCHQSHNYHWKSGQQNAIYWNFQLKQAINRKIVWICWMSWNSLLNRFWKFQLSILKNKKSFIPKKYDFSRSL